MSDESMDEMEMDPEMQAIVFNCEEILSNIELDLNIQLFDDLYEEHIYIEMFKKMFPFMHAKIISIEKSPASTGEKLQSLINCLSNDVLTMDLSHIKGQGIAEKDSRPLINFLQIILELSKLYSMKKDPNQDDETEEQYDEHSNNQQHNNVPPQNNSRSHQGHHDNDEEAEDHNEEPDEEGIYREEADDEDGRSPQYQHQDDYNNQQQRLTKKKSQNNLIPDDNKQTFNPHAAPYQQQIVYDNIQQQEHDQEEQYVQQTLSEEQRIDTEKIQELFGLFKSGLITEEDPRLEELHYLLSKYGLSLEDILRQEIFNQQNPQDQQNGDSTLAQVIKVSQSGLQRMKNPKSFAESGSNKMVYEKQKNYQKFLKDYKRDYERKMKKVSENNESNINRMPADQRKQRFVEHEDKMLRKEYEDEQKSLYFQMRDKKVQYLRNIHKIIFELEKKKIIDEQNEYNEKKKQMEDDAKNRLISIENKYKNRIKMLKEGLEQKKRERHVAEVAQKQELSRQERELKDRKRKQIEDLKELWKSEREKFDMITKDDRKLENQILELYKKY